MKIKYFLLIIVFILIIPLIWAPSDGAGSSDGGDGDTHGEGGDGGEDSESASAHDCATAAADAAKSAAAAAGLSPKDQTIAGYMGYMDTMSKAIGGITATASTPGSVNGISAFSTEAGGISMSMSISVGYTGTGVASVSVSGMSFSATDKKGTAVSAPSGSTSFSNLNHALSFQEKQNSDISSNSFWSGVKTIAGLALNAVPGIGQIKTALTVYSVVSTVYDMAVNHKTPTDIVSEKMDGVQEVANRVSSSMETAYNDVQSATTQESVDSMQNAIGTQPSESPSTMSVASIDSRTGPIY